MALSQIRKYSRKLFLLSSCAAIAAPAFGLLVLQFRHVNTGLPRPGVRLPAIRVSTLNSNAGAGIERSIDDIREGKPALLVYAKPECGFCRVEMGTIEQLARVQSSTVRLITVLVVENESDRAAAAELMREHPALPFFVDRARSFRTTFAGGGVPLAVAVSSGGVIRNLDRGERTLEYFQTLIDRLQREEARP